MAYASQRLKIVHIEQAHEIAAQLAEALRADAGDDVELVHLPEAPMANGTAEGPDADVILLGVSNETQALEDLRRLRTLDGTPPILALLAPDATTEEASVLREGALDVLRWRSSGISFRDLLLRVLRNTHERHVLRAGLDDARRLGMHLAHHDPLTDLPNRLLFRTRLGELIAMAKRQMRSLAVLFLDLDRFKHINDTLGHTVGDRLLQKVSKRLTGCVRESDTVARRGGDEFTVILDGIRRGQDAARVAKKILKALTEPFDIDGHELYVGASIGISLYPADGGDVETLIKHADIAMYRAKARDGNNYQFFLPEMNVRALERLELEGNLRVGLQRDELVLHYQPQLDLRTGRVCGMEALVRWQHPDLGLVYPDEFIPLAEETGIISQLGDWVLARAVRQNKQWQEMGIDPICIAVNFSARQFQLNRPAERIAELLKEYDLAPECLDLELTESVVMKDPSFAMEVLGQLRDLGVEISIDDFGMGYSSLAYLKRFPISRLKIDRAFIRNLLVDPRDAAITDAIIRMAHNLGIDAVAEGVETAEQLAHLRGPGCDQMQGYFFSKPLPAEQATALLVEGRSLEPVGAK